MEERRRSYRKSARIPVKLRVVWEGDDIQISEPIDANIRDLSLDGMAIETSVIKVDGLHISYNNHPSKKNKLYLQWALPSGRAIKAVGETIWYERASPASSVFVVGLRFVEISPEDLKFLKEFIHQTTGGRPINF